MLRLLLRVQLLDLLHLRALRDILRSNNLCLVLDLVQSTRQPHLLTSLCLGDLLGGTRVPLMQLPLLLVDLFLSEIVVGNIVLGFIRDEPLRQSLLVIIIDESSRKAVCDSLFTVLLP